jgi:hypothetical protein
MMTVRIAIWGAIGALACGCGGAAKPKQWTGGITLSASGSWNVPYPDGSSIVGSESFSAHCTNNGDGVGEFTASFTMHNLATSTDGMKSTADASGTADQPLTQDNTGCLLGAGGNADGNWGVEFKLSGFNVTGQRVAGGVSVPIDDDWSNEDLAMAGTFSGTTFLEPQSGASGAVAGMFAFNSGDVVGGSPSMVVGTLSVGTPIPEIVSWSYAPLN